MQIYDLLKETHPDYWTVHTPLIYRKIVEIEDFALQMAVLDDCQIYLKGGGGGVERFREEELKTPTPGPSVDLKLRWPPVPVSAPSWRSYEKR